MSKYKIGDKVRIVNYGHLIHESSKEENPLSFKTISDNGQIRTMDMLPELVGKEGVVEKVSENQGYVSYAIDGIQGKHSWYDEDQLELVVEENFDFTRFGFVLINETDDFKLWTKETKGGSEIFVYDFIGTITIDLRVNDSVLTVCSRYKCKNYDQIEFLLYNGRIGGLLK